MEYKEMLEERHFMVAKVSMVGVELGYGLVRTYSSREGDMSWGHGPG